jgi:Predicted ATPase
MLSWIVIGREKDKIKLVSKNNVDALLPKGSYLTIVKPEECKSILRVEDSYQDFPYSPSPMIIDMDLPGLTQDQKCQNIVYAYPIKDLNERTDGLINFIKPYSCARRSNQEEIDLAMGYEGVNNGPKIFLGTVHGTQNQILTDSDGNYLTASLPEAFYYHQTLVCGKTGSGKTVCTKYLAQYFVEKMNGAVLAINVKDTDFLKMDKPTNIENLSSKDKENFEKEWFTINEKPHGVSNYYIYYPSTSTPNVNSSICIPVTLDVRQITPESLNGILQNISELGAQYLPDIFNYWREERGKTKKDEFKFKSFVNWFKSINMLDKDDGKNQYPTKNKNGDNGMIPLHPSTVNSLLGSLEKANLFFDQFNNTNVRTLSASDILQASTLSIIDIATEDTNAKIFGSILLRQLLSQIVDKKRKGESNYPVLIIIDEVHQFYNTESSKDALGDLDTICRQGRSQKIGVIFSSQNPSDIPNGLSSVINTKIFFKSDSTVSKITGISVTNTELENLKTGYAIVNIHNRTQLKVVKFPLSLAYAFEVN